VWTSEGEPVSIELPYVPKAGMGETILTLCGLVPVCLIVVWVVFKQASGFIGLLSSADAPGGGIVIFGLFLVIGLVIALTAFWQAGSLLRMLLAREPVLEIHSDGLIDRRVLKRKIGWDEFHPLNRRHALSTSIARRPIDPTFRLKDGSVRKFSPISAFWSTILSGKRVHIDTLGFEEQPAVISELIHTMIRNAPQKAKQNGSSD